MEDDSSEFQGELPEIINRSELRCVRDLDLNVFNTRTSQALTGSSATQTKPTNAVLVDSIFLTTPRSWIKRRSLDFVTMYDDGVEGVPKYFAEDDATSTDVRLARIPDQAYAAIWWTYSRPDKLEDTANETNWLTDNVGDLLYQACVVESAKYLGMFEQLGPENDDYMTKLGGCISEFKNVSRRNAKELEQAARIGKE
jgi:hypothetical protein